MNRWKKPRWLEDEVIARDLRCIYCGVMFDSVPGHGSQRSWEHIVNDGRIVTRENIALCCRGCNSSKGRKPLADWIDSPYCQKRGITREKVSEIVRVALRNPN